MRATPAAQQRLLHDYKFPFTKEGKRRPQIVRYSEARAAVGNYHKNSNDLGILEDAVEALLHKRATQPELDAARLLDNVRGITAYQQNFASSKYEILENPKPKFVHGDVTVSATPDLYVKESGVPKLLRLDFSATRPEKDAVQMILRITHAACQMTGIDVASKNILYIEIGRGVKHQGKDLNKRLKADVEAACEMISAIWPRLNR